MIWSVEEEILNESCQVVVGTWREIGVLVQLHKPGAEVARPQAQGAADGHEVVEELQEGTDHVRRNVK
jgi:hypothetical protein